jgi:hypothetical protein
VAITCTSVTYSNFANFPAGDNQTLLTVLDDTHNAILAQTTVSVTGFGDGQPSSGGPFTLTFPAPAGTVQIEADAYDVTAGLPVDLGPNSIVTLPCGQPPPNCPPSPPKVNVRWHYSVNGSSGSWSATSTPPCGSPFSIGPQAMEGHQTVQPGTVIKAGYDFTIPGNNTLHTVTFSNAQVTFPVVCAGGAIPLQSTFTVPLGSASYSAPDSKWYPSGDQASSLVYQGSYTVPTTLCTGGGAIILGQGGSRGGGTFSATLGIS